MKKLLLLGALCTIWITYSSNAQAILNDPSYSVHNYKHPNKAAIAKEIQDKRPTVYLEEVKEQDEKQGNNLTSESNYKTMKPEKFKMKKFRAIAQPKCSPVYKVSNNGNYKQQFPPRQRVIAKR